MKSFLKQKQMQKTSIILILALALITAFALTACKKQTVYNARPLTITVFNGLDNGYLIYGNYSGSRPASFRSSQQITNGFATSVNFELADVTAKYYISPDTLEKDQPVFDQLLNAENGKSYSLYILGDKPAADYLFFENQFIQYKPSDSATYLQCVNISNDQPISINIKGQANGSLVNNLPFKGATQFIELNASAENASYEFEFRDAASGELLFTELVSITPGPGDQNRYLYRNWAMVFMGKRGASDVNALKVRKTFFQGN